MSRPVNALLQAWRRTCGEAPDALAIREAESGAACTRAELSARAGAAAIELGERVTERRVLFSQPNGIGWFVRLLALLEAGAVPVPVDPTEPRARVRELGMVIGAAAVWTEEGVERLVAAGRRDREAGLIKLTSGSTGAPRALRFSGEQMLADGRHVCRTMDIRPDDLNLALIPCGHSYGLGNVVVPLLAQGTPLLVPRAPLPRVLAEDCARWRPTVFPSVPPLLRLLAAADVDPASLHSLRTVISAGTVLPPETARAFVDKFERPVHGFYGSSETGGISYDRTGDATLSGRSVGALLDGVRLVPAARGRWAVESAAVFTLGNRLRGTSGHGRHCPADRLKLTPDGEVVLAGRTGRMVKIAGRRLDLAELERALRAVPGVSDAFAQSHPQRPDELAAVLQTERAEKELRSDLATLLPAWKIPRRLVLVPQFPLTARSKPDRARLLRLLGHGG